LTRNLLDIDEERRTTANKNYISIAFSVLIAEITARNNFGVARQESNPQSATVYSSVRLSVISSFL
jgi:hypothetical protein